MIKVLDSSLNTLAILENVVSPIILEEINREFTFSFTTVIDNDKSNYVNYQHKAEIEDNYFNIVYTEEERTQESLMINVQCEHVSYDLISANLTAGFTATGLFSAVATTLLSGTDFTVGTVETTASETISVNESTNKRQILMQLASLYGGELKFDKYAVSLLTRRGADRGVQFRYRKNLTGVKRIVDNRKKVGGLPTISYSINVAELEFEQSYIDKGYGLLERYELGDTVKVIDEDLNLEVSLRIVKESHDTEQRMQGNVEIANFVDDLTDTITNIQTTTVAKDNIYNGCSIGPDNGFVAERSDELVKTSMNATNGLEIDLRDTITSSYTAVFYVQVDTATGTAKLFLAGNAEFTGTVRGSEIIGGSITIGTGSDTFNANGTDGIWLGSTAFLTAPFNVSLSGSTTAYDLTLRGGLFNIGTGTNTLQFNTTDGLFLGATSIATAPFSVAMSGAMTATDFTLTGGLIRTAVSGERVELFQDSIKCYNSSNNLHGFSTESASATFGDAFFYDNGTKVLEFYNNLNDDGYSIRSVGSATLFLGGLGKNTYLEGDVKYVNATSVTGLDTDTEASHNHTVTIGTATYTTSYAGSHNHTVKKA